MFWKILVEALVQFEGFNFSQPSQTGCQKPSVVIDRFKGRSNPGIAAGRPFHGSLSYGSASFCSPASSLGRVYEGPFRGDSLVSCSPITAVHAGHSRFLLHEPCSVRRLCAETGRTSSSDAPAASGVANVAHKKRRSWGQYKHLR